MTGGSSLSSRWGGRTIRRRLEKLGKARRLTIMAMPAGRVEQKPILQTAAEDGEFNQFVQAIDYTGLRDLLEGEGPYTIFAPTDEAFARLSSDGREMLMHDHKDLREMLKYHMVKGIVTSEDLRRLGSVRALEGRELSFYQWGEQTTVNGARIVKPDIACKNGIIHAIDRLVTP
jgi:uncharacterized surface protein with fasciclin (FAS1) repeats